MFCVVNSIQCDIPSHSYAMLCLGSLHSCGGCTDAEHTSKPFHWPHFCSSASFPRSDQNFQRFLQALLKTNSGLNRNAVIFLIFDWGWSSLMWWASSRERGSGRWRDQGEGVCCGCAGGTVAGTDVQQWLLMQKSWTQNTSAVAAPRGEKSYRKASQGLSDSHGILNNWSLFPQFEDTAIKYFLLPIRGTLTGWRI